MQFHCVLEARIIFLQVNYIKQILAVLVYLWIIQHSISLKMAGEHKLITNSQMLSLLLTTETKKNMYMRTVHIKAKRLWLQRKVADVIYSSFAFIFLSLTNYKHTKLVLLWMCNDSDRKWEKCSNENVGKIRDPVNCSSSVNDLSLNCF